MRGWGLLLLVIAWTLAAAPGAHATYPGANGKLLVAVADSTSGYDIWTMNPDGTGATNLTNTPGVDERDGSWSPDGTKIAFYIYPRLWTMNADGTNRTDVTPDVSGAPFYSAHVQPTSVAWSPDGTRIAFTNQDGCAPNHSPGQLLLIDPDGSNPTQVVCHWPYVPPGTIKGAGGAVVDWSPDGQRLTLAGPVSLGCEADTWVVNRDGTGMTDITQGNTGNEGPSDWSPNGARIATGEIDDCIDGVPQTWTMNPDGTGRVQLPASVNVPIWSPDNNKFVYANGNDIAIANTDGSGAVNLTNTPSVSEYATDWLAIPQNAYPRPKGATPTHVSFTTAYNQCTTADRTHGPPLAFPSCAGPQKSSANLTVGTGDSNGKPALNEGSLTMSVMPGVPGGVDDTDVGLTFLMDDVFTNALADYSGELRAHVVLQITDKDNTPAPSGPSGATVQEAPLDLVVACTPVADPNEGSSCTSSTSVDALVPGAAPEGKRAIWQLGRVEVYDGGADGDANTPAGDTLFATQGIFIP